MKYYNKVDEQAFGVDLEARARRRIRNACHIIVTASLTYPRPSAYPDLERG